MAALPLSMRPGQWQCRCLLSRRAIATQSWCYEYVTYVIYWILETCISNKCHARDALELHRRSAAPSLRVAYQTLPRTGLTTRCLQRASLCYIRTVAFTCGEKAAEYPVTCLEIGVGNIREKVPAQSLHNRHDSLGQLYSGRSEMQGPGALIVRIRAPNDETASAELIQQTDQAGPFDVHLIGERILAHAIVLPDSHERRRKRARETKCGQLVIVAATELLPERTESRHEGHLESVPRRC